MLFPLYTFSSLSLYIYIYIYTLIPKKLDNEGIVWGKRLFSFLLNGATTLKMEFIFLLILSLKVFGKLSSSLLLFPQRFGRYILRPFSGVGRTRYRLQIFFLISNKR